MTTLEVLDAPHDADETNAADTDVQHVTGPVDFLNRVHKFDSCRGHHRKSEQIRTFVARPRIATGAPSRRARSPHVRWFGSAPGAAARKRFRAPLARIRRKDVRPAEGGMLFSIRVPPA